MKKIFATLILGLIIIPQLAMAGDDDKGGGKAKTATKPAAEAPANPKPSETKTEETPPDTTTDKTDTKPTESPSGASEKFDLNALRITQKTSDGNISQGTSFFNRKDANGNPVSPITAFILTAIEFLTKIIGSVAFFVLILSGVWMIVTTGEETQVNKAKDMMLYSIIGIAVAFGSYMIVTFIQGLFIQ
ncbi:MAG: pilin [Patescibacteria group bacterium]|mgnify:FL=1